MAAEKCETNCIQILVLLMLPDWRLKFLRRLPLINAPEL
jgi:hypothetical protein